MTFLYVGGRILLPITFAAYIGPKLIAKITQTRHTKPGVIKNGKSIYPPRNGKLPKKAAAVVRIAAIMIGCQVVTSTATMNNSFSTKDIYDTATIFVNASVKELVIKSCESPWMRHPW